MQFEHLLKHAPPCARGKEGQQTFYDKHQCKRGPNIVHTHPNRWPIAVARFTWLAKLSAMLTRPQTEPVNTSNYFLAAAAAPGPPVRMALKNSDDGSNTITSLFLPKLAL